MGLKNKSVKEGGDERKKIGGERENVRKEQVIGKRRVGKERK